MMLTDLADAARKSGLIVIELADWQTNVSAGAFDPEGILCHHTGSYDGLADAASDRDYARWLAFEGRDLDGDGVKDPPLCNLALSAEGVVYVCSAGNANHAGKAKATGPMPAAADGNALYVGIEAMNSGSQGWNTVGKDAGGDPVTQGEAYARLCAALCLHYGWPASHVRGHKETSVTGKWDPGLLDMDKHRAAVAALMEDDDMALTDQDIDKIADAVLARALKSAEGNSVGRVLGFLFTGQRAGLAALAALAESQDDTVRAAVTEALADAVVNVDVNVNQNGA